MTFDPTTNRIPFALLTEAEQGLLMEACKSNGCQYYSNGEWITTYPVWRGEAVYRAKPAPEVKSTLHNVYKALGVMPYIGAISVTLEESQRGETRIICLDLIDGKLSIKLDPLEDKP